MKESILIREKRFAPIYAFKRRGRKTIKLWLVSMYISVIAISRLAVFLWSCRNTKWVFWSDWIYWVFQLPPFYLLLEWLLAHRFLVFWKQNRIIWLVNYFVWTNTCGIYYICRDQSGSCETVFCCFIYKPDARCVFIFFRAPWLVVNCLCFLLLVNCMGICICITYTANSDLYYLVFICSQVLGSSVLYFLKY